MSRIFAATFIITLCWGQGYAEPPTDAGARAEAHSKRGVELYQQGKLAEAVREMLEAYKAVPDPALLFNIARIYEKLGERDIAIGYYARFVTVEGADPTRVQKAIEYLRALRAAAKQPVAPPAPVVVAPPHPPPTPPKTAPPPPGVASTPAMVGVDTATSAEPRSWIGPTALGTVGVGMLVGGGIFAVRAGKANKDVRSYSVDFPARVDAQKRGRKAALNADLLTAGGGLALLGAALWYFAGAPDAPADAQPGLVAGLGDGGAFIGWTGALP